MNMRYSLGEQDPDQQTTTVLMANPLMVSADVTVKAAIALMGEVSSSGEILSTDTYWQREARASCVLVVESRRVLGILTEREAMRLCAQQPCLDEIPIAQVMTQPVLTLPESALTDARAVMDLLQQKQIKQLPIVDHDDHVVGLVTLNLLMGHHRELEEQVARRTAILQQQLQREQAVTHLATQISLSVDLPTIFELAVGQIHHLLGGDRAIVWQLDTEASCIAVAEATHLPQSQLGQRVTDYCMQTFFPGVYREGYGRIVSDIDTADLTECHRELLISLQIRAKVLLPLFCRDRLWGLLSIVETQRPREWQAEEIELLRKFATQLTIAIQQQDTERRQAQAEGDRSQAFQSLAQLNVELEERIIRRTKALAEREARYRALMEGAADAILLSSPDGQILEANQQAATLLGYSLTELTTLNFRQLHPPEVLPQAIAAFSETLHKPRVQIADFPCQRRDGSIVLVDITSCVIKINGETLIQSIFHDVSKRQAAQQALQVSEAKYRQLIETALEGIWLIDADANHVFGNAALFKMMGLSAEEMAGRSLFDFFAPEVHPQIVELLERRRAGIAETNEVPLPRPDGSTLWVLASSSPIFDEAGQYIGAMSMLTDITQQKQTEAALREAQQFLQTVLDTVPLSVFWKNRDSRYLGANQRFLEDVGLSDPAELPGKSDFDVVWNATEAETYRADDRMIMETGEGMLGMVTAWHHQDGSITWLEANKLPLRNLAGEIVGVLGTYQDITERKQVEIELQTLTDRLTLALQVGAYGVWEWDLINCPIWNERMYEIYGLQNVGEPVRYQDWRVLVHPEDLPMLEAQLKTILRDGLSLNSEFRVYRMDGELRWISSIAQSYCDEQGNPLRVVGINQDITERKQVEIELKALTERLTLALQAGDFGTWDWDGVNEVNWDERMYAIYGMEDLRERAIYPTWRNSLHPDDQDRIEALLHAAFRGEADYDTEFRILRPNGELRWIQAIAKVQVNSQGQPIRMVGMNQDITDRKRVEQELYGSRAKLQRLVDDIGDNFLIFSHDGEIVTYVSGGFEAIFGMPAEQILGKSWATAINWLPDSLAAAIPQLNQMIATKTNTQKLEMLFTHPSGSIRTIRVVQHPVWDKGGNLLAIEGVVEDITDQKIAEAELRRTNAELERATRLKDEFLANMSHELRTPLNAILGMAEGLQDDVFGVINETQRKALKTIESSAMHLLSLINDILDVAKIESGQIKVECALVSVDLLCSSSLTFVKQQALNKQIQLKTQIQPRLPDIFVDEIRIRQVLLNLLTNAVKFTNEGGTVTLSAAFVPGETLETPGHLHIAVTDTGIGIASEHIPKLFKPFVQIDGALNRKHMGTGLGLALVKQIVELHGGQVGLTSELGVGSCFTVDLPYLPQDLAASQPTAIAPELPQMDGVPSLNQAPLILLAEDNPANMLTLSSYLGAKGYRFIFANNGQEAVAMALSDRPDVILMDIQMPGMDGLEAIRRIRQQEGPRPIPIIALTALVMKGDREQCLEAGANHYFSKPVKIKQLDLAIRELLAQQDSP